MWAPYSLSLFSMTPGLNFERFLERLFACISVRLGIKSELRKKENDLLLGHMIALEAKISQSKPLSASFEWRLRSIIINKNGKNRKRCYLIWSDGGRFDGEMFINIQFIGCPINFHIVYRIFDGFFVFFLIRLFCIKHDKLLILFLILCLIECEIARRNSAPERKSANDFAIGWRVHFTLSLPHPVFDWQSSDIHGNCETYLA